MNASIHVATRPQSSGASPWLLTLVWPLGTALAAPTIEPSPVPFTVTIDAPLRLAGNGLLPRPLTASGMPVATGGPRSAAADAARPGGFPDGALSKLGSADRDGLVQFSLARTLGDQQRLTLHGRFHLSRQEQHTALRGSQANRYRASPELALGLRLAHELAIGAEYRFRPDNRNPAGPFGAQPRDGAWKDVYLAWTPSSHFSLTASYVDLGRLTPAKGGARQIGHYLAASFWY